MAIGAIACLTENGFRVPEDVAVIGYNDIPEAQYLNPPLATMGLNVDKAIDLLADAIIKGMGGEPVKENIEINASLNIRKSAQID